MKVALGQINPTVGDIDGNVAKMIELINQARQARAELIIFPELAISGYPPMDLLLKDSFIQANLNGLARLKEHAVGLAVIAGFVDINSGSGRPLFNACAVMEDREIKAVQCKTLLPSYDVFDENRYFEPAKNYVSAQIGSDSIRFGLSICEDIWNELSERPLYQIDPIEKIVESQPQILLNISASPFCLGKDNLRHELVAHQARTRGIPVIYVNQVGGNDELIFDGRSIVCSASGELVARANEFEEDLLFLNLEVGKDKRVTVSGTIKPSCDDPVAASYLATVLGTRDYVRKCGFKKCVIGLSGGIDSAVTAAIAVKAVGGSNVVGVAMPSPYSSPGSLDDAQTLAKNLTIDYKVIPINLAMTAYEEMLAPAFVGTKSDVTEENIQARIRGTILMSLSNKFGYLVLTTGNKSELAVGYCTLYGDMCGGLAVISDLPKTLVYEIARYINKEAGKEIIPQATIEKAPSAELRPGQVDQDSLPPYVVLDDILKAYVEQRRKADEIVNLGYQPDVVMDLINKIDKNEYKRHQAAPGLKVTERAFGVGWRMPIAQRFKETVGHDSVEVFSK